MNLIGTKTAVNLMKSFAGESQARMRYTYYASIAKKEGYLQIANIFLETADNEKEHAKVFYKHLVAGGLEGDVIEITAAFPVGMSTSTLTNLGYAAAGEHEEWQDLYPEFAAVAQEEGFLAIAKSFKEIALVEQHHEARYIKLASNIEKDEVFKKEEPTEWICSNCGHVHHGSEAPLVCPACLHDRSHFELLCENY